jgi:dinuclear metal center YbgI/SA1388 family protein
MVQRSTLIKFLDNYLEAQLVKDVAMNGLQVEGKKEIEKIALGVSASLELFQKAKDLKTDAIIVHHGLFWGQAVPIKGFLKERINTLLKADINLMAYHLPLDKHPVIGNNAQILKLFKATKHIEPFAKYNGQMIGFRAQFDNPLTIQEIIKIIETKLFTKAFCLSYGKNSIEKIAVVSGAASETIYEAINEDVDLLITGETAEYIPELVKESKINFISAGHYNSERLGIIALGKLIEEEFNIKAEFIDVPNPI